MICKFKLSKDTLKHIALQTAFILLILSGCFFMLEFSSGESLTHLSAMDTLHILLNYITLGALFASFVIITNRCWLSGVLCSCVCGVIAIINHYVLIFHGMPLSFLVLKNFSTAMKVTSSYNFSIDRIVAILIVSIILLCGISLVFKCFIKKRAFSGRKLLVRNILLLVIVFSLIYSGYYGDHPLKPKKTIGWLWSEAYHTYGYAACTIESISQSLNVINKPEGYSEQAVYSIEIANKMEEQASTPDIILILNESFYDLRQITDITTDIPYMENIESLENTFTGYAVTPSVGGGTNSSEYELLTSNSLQLMPGITPFNTLDLYNANSIVSHLEQLGYNTLASHPQDSSNYARGQGYPAIGFDNSYFRSEFSDVEFYYGRDWYETDESIYKNLIQWYESAPKNTPHFQYMLTIQNHGEWEFNDAQYDLVHTLKDYGEYTSSINEYLTGIHLSDLAFKQLTDYFSTVDRPVILCMLGDHAPNFAASIIDPKYSEQEQQLLLRKVPLIIWANFPLVGAELGTMSMNYVVPTILDYANVELSPYYSYMLQAKEQVPVISSYGYYYDADGNLFKYTEDHGEPYESIVDDYFLLEYNNLHSSRIQNLFTAYHQ